MKTITGVLLMNFFLHVILSLLLLLLSKSSNSNFWCVFICIWYTIFANIECECTYSEKIRTKNKSFVKVKELNCMFIVEKNQQSKSCPSCMLHTYLTWYMSLPKFIISYSMVDMACTRFRHQGDRYIMAKVRVLLNTTCLLASTKYCQNISNHILKSLV